MVKKTIVLCCYYHSTVKGAQAPFTVLCYYYRYSMIVKTSHAYYLGRDFSRLNNLNVFVFANVCDFGKLFKLNTKKLFTRAFDEQLNRHYSCCLRCSRTKTWRKLNKFTCSTFRNHISPLVTFVLTTCAINK